MLIDAACAAKILSSEALCCRLGVVADVGQTLNSSVTYTHLVASNPDVSPLQSAWDICWVVSDGIAEMVPYWCPRATTCSSDGWMKAF